jgi:hypothetical protein
VLGNSNDGMCTSRVGGVFRIAERGIEDSEDCADRGGLLMMGKPANSVDVRSVRDRRRRCMLSLALCLGRGVAGSTNWLGLGGGEAHDGVDGTEVAAAIGAGLGAITNSSGTANEKLFSLSSKNGTPSISGLESGSLSSLRGKGDGEVG